MAVVSRVCRLSDWVKRPSKSQVEPNQVLTLFLACVYNITALFNFIKALHIHARIEHTVKYQPKLQYLMVWI